MGRSAPLAVPYLESSVMRQIIFSLVSGMLLGAMQLAQAGVLGYPLPPIPSDTSQGARNAPPPQLRFRPWGQKGSFIPAPPAAAYVPGYAPYYERETAPPVPSYALPLSDPGSTAFGYRDYTPRYDVPFFPRQAPLPAYDRYFP